jgi:hypothetical protein
VAVFLFQLVEADLFALAGRFPLKMENNSPEKKGVAFCPNEARTACCRSRPQSVSGSSSRLSECTRPMLGGPKVHSFALGSDGGSLPLSSLNQIAGMNYPGGCSFARVSAEFGQASFVMPSFWTPLPQELLVTEH